MAKKNVENVCISLMICLHIAWFLKFWKFAATLPHNFRNAFVQGCFGGVAEKESVAVIREGYWEIREGY